jgi:hypothetical protein
MRPISRSQTDALERADKVDALDVFQRVAFAVLLRRIAKRIGVDV